MRVRGRGTRDDGCCTRDDGCRRAYGGITELKDVGSEEEDEVLGAADALPVLPRQNDCTHPKYACVELASQPVLMQLETADPGYP